MSIENVNSMIDTISNGMVDKTNIISAEFFYGANKKHVKLIDADGNVTAKSSELLYSLKYPTYVSSVTIFSDDNISKELIFQTYAHDGAEKKRVPVKIDREGKAAYRFPVGEIVSGFGIKSATGLLLFSFQPKITRLQVFGTDPETLERAADVYARFENLKKEIVDECVALRDGIASGLDNLSAREAAVADKEKAFEARKNEANGKLLDIEGAIVTATSQLMSLQSSAADLEMQVLSQKNTLSGINREIESKIGFKSEREAEVESLTKKIIELRQELASLLENRNLFSDEISSYAEQGNLHVRSYMFLSLIPVLVLAVMCIQILNNAKEFADMYAHLGGWSNSIAALVARLPYAAIFLSVVFACVRIISILFSRIFQVHTQRLDFSEISILAKDFTDAARKNVDVTDALVYESRLKYKMDLFRQYLTKKSRINDGLVLNLNVPRKAAKQKDGMGEIKGEMSGEPADSPNGSRVNEG